ncbi:hypothetical protein [Natrinema sp. 74]|uniref:hypothetical protein n=1 Tax=Natrinema sp. 74 TaxID=3384159 RepID=UPI0038D39B71
MPAGGRSIRTKQCLRIQRRLAALESELETTRERVRRLENTLREAVRTADDVSIGGPCSCGESLLLVRDRTLYCPECRYRRTV